ncbi:MAG: phosphopantetheine-binding protein, partial [Bacillota bacterium]
SPNGKADRKALPEPIGSINTGTEYVEPTGIIERKLAKIWQEVLGLESVGVKDNFFDLGGTSLLLIRMHSRVEALYPGRVKVTDIFSNPTISKLAEFIEDGEKTQGRDIGFTFLELPGEYFTGEGNGAYGSYFKFHVRDNILKSLEEMAKREKVEKIDIMLSAYIYLLGQAAKKHSITVQTLLDDSGMVLPVSVDLKDIRDFGELGRLINKKRIIGSEPGYSLGDISEETAAGKSNLSILPFFCQKGLLLRPRNLTGIYDITFEVSEEYNQICFICEYNASRLKNDKVKELVNMYMKVIQFIINN